MKKMIFLAVAVFFLVAALWGSPSLTWAQDGKKVYDDKCLPCHGEKGDGKGPLAVTFTPPPGSFSDAKFWQGNVNKKISDSIAKGKNQMPPVDLKPEEVKAVTEYMTKTFKK